MLSPHPEQLAQIRRTKRGYVHKNDPDAYTRKKRSSSLCKLTDLQKRTAAQYLDERLKTNRSLKDAYKDMMEKGYLTDKDGNIMQAQTFGVFSWRRKEFLGETKTDIACRRAYQAIKERGGLIQCRPCELWLIIKDPQDNSVSTKQGAAVSASRITAQLRDDGKLDVQRINDFKTVYKIIGD